ncbi:Oidioi.mRNA.OKI2018_I69.XSR.g13665.t1.cds [Oikopleura dioica]|uniref:Oidioi.mRNA.OKI2018_I69.XSR.g13665.t1.cds n=1 Tax=Oikopleura dioica TaxID=34765 RepID=A0ABN7SG25_OIKDI|nr:Oidioi.mRNA.OKI2018_I69.XSR.g13665.t1.cds [Oikopleura dioica]
MNLGSENRPVLGVRRPAKDLQRKMESLNVNKASEAVTTAPAEKETKGGLTEAEILEEAVCQNPDAFDPSSCNPGDDLVDAFQSYTSKKIFGTLDDKTSGTNFMPFPWMDRNNKRSAFEDLDHSFFDHSSSSNQSMSPPSHYDSSFDLDALDL